MALLFMDSFDHYVTADITEKYVSTSGSATILPTGGRRSSGALQILSTTAASYAISKVLSPNATVVVGVAHKYTAVPANISGIFDIRSGGTVQLTVTISTAGVIHVRRGGTTGTIIATGPVIPTGAFIFLEMKSAIHASTGTIALRINGVDAFAPLTGQNTSNTGTAAWDQILLGNTSGSTD